MRINLFRGTKYIFILINHSFDIIETYIY